MEPVAKDSPFTSIFEDRTARPHRDWWRPVWRSQLFDGSLNHREKLGSAVWLYLYLLLHVDSRTGAISRSLGQLAAEILVPKKTVRDWLARLRKTAYVSVKREGSLLQIQVIHFRKPTWQSRDRYSTLWRPKSDASAPKTGRPI